MEEEEEGNEEGGVRRIRGWRGQPVAGGSLVHTVMLTTADTVHSEEAQRLWQQTRRPMRGDVAVWETGEEGEVKG